MNNRKYNKINNISECNLLHDIINYSKHTKVIGSQYFPIFHGCINTCGGRPIFNNFRILLDSLCGYMVIMRRLIKKN